MGEQPGQWAACTSVPHCLLYLTPGLTPGTWASCDPLGPQASGSLEATHLDVCSAGLPRLMTLSWPEVALGGQGPAVGPGLAMALPHPVGTTASSLPIGLALWVRAWPLQGTRGGGHGCGGRCSPGCWPGIAEHRAGPTLPTCDCRVTSCLHGCQSGPQSPSLSCFGHLYFSLPGTSMRSGRKTFMRTTNW